MAEQKKYLIQQSMLLLMSFIFLLWVFPIGGAIDLKLISLWVDETGQFPYKSNWYLAKLNHDYVKYLIIGVYSLYFSAWILSFKIQKLQFRRVEFGYFFFVSMLCTITIGLMKSNSAHACPWDMTVPTHSGFIWDFSSTNGHCFPGGHASSGFALMTGYFVYLKSNIKRAYFFLFSGLILGFSMGWAQMMRGAHFLSHNLWTGWIIWFINILVSLIYNKLKEYKTLKNINKKRRSIHVLTNY